MPSSLSWTDAEGAATLTNGKLTPADRYADWTVSRRPIGPEAVQVNTGRIYRTEYRRDQLVRFEARYIPESQTALMARLQYHLLKGGEVTLVGDRTAAAQFATCVISPGTEPNIRQSDPRLREYTFSVELRSWVADGWGGGSGPGVQPPVTDFLIWYKADALLAEGYVHGDTLVQWIDSSGNGYHATPDIHTPLSPNSATLSTTWPYGGNALPTVRFVAHINGTGAQMASPPYPHSLGRTFIILARVHTEATRSASKAFASLMGDNNATFSQYEASFGVPSGTWAWHQPARDIGGDTVYYRAAAVILTPTAGQCYMDGSPAGASFTPSGAITYTVDSVELLRPGQIVLGGYDKAAGGNNSDCVIREVLLYNRALTVAELQSIVVYLYSKYEL